MATKLHKWNDILAKRYTPEQIASLKKQARRELLELELRELRELAGMTQLETAAAAEMAQGAVSNLEREGGDRLLSTLRRYVEALGGELELVARFGDKTIRLRGV